MKKDGGGDKEPRLIRQKDSGGCVIASLAMVTGRSYDDVRAEVHDFDNRNSANFRDTEAFLFKHGYLWQQVWKYEPGNKERNPWPLQPWADVHMVEVRMPSNTHSVVMLRDGTVLDPLCDEPKRLTDYAEVYSMRAVYPPLSSPSHVATSDSMLRPECPGLDRCLRAVCMQSSRCAIHGDQYVKDVIPLILEALMEPCKGCGKRPIDFVEGEGATPSATRRTDADERRPCTCHPDERPIPCQQKFALNDCRAAAALSGTTDGGNDG